MEHNDKKESVRRITRHILQKGLCDPQFILRMIQYEITIEEIEKQVKEIEEYINETNEFYEILKEED